MRIYIYYIASFLFLALFAEPLTAQNGNKNLGLQERRKFDYYFYEAMNASAKFEYQQAMDYLMHCHKIDSTNAHVLYELGNYYLNLKDNKTAKSYLKKAVSYDNNNLYYNMAYANLALEDKEYELARESYLKLLENYPNKSELYVFLSESYRLDGDLANAITALDRLEENIGLNEKISMQKFQLYAMLGRENEGFAEIQKYIDKQPNEIQHRILLGNLYLRANRPEQAFAVFQDAQKLEPENPYLISSIADYYEQVDDKDAAEKELQKAVLSPSMDIDTKLGILAQYVSSLQQSEKDTRVANPLFLELMELHPQEPDLNLLYGNLLMLQESKNAAFDQFHLYAQAHPSNAMGWEHMLSASFPDSIAKIIFTCEEALKSIPEEAQFYFYLGLGQYLNDQHGKALKTLEKGLSYVAKDDLASLSNFHGQIGDIQHQMGDSSKAFESYEQAIRYNPNNMGILNNYSYFLALSQIDLDKAERMSGLTIKSEPTNPTYLDTYGWVLFKQKAYSLAKIYIERSMEHTGSSDLSAEVLEHYGDVLYKLKEEDKALEYWGKAKELSEEKKTLHRLNKKIETKSYIEENATK